VGNDTEDNWVANSFTAGSNSHIVSVSLPIRGNFTDQSITAFIYQGFDLFDPTAGGGLVLLGQTTTTITTTRGDIVTIPLSPPVDLNSGDIFYAAVLIPAVPSSVLPFYSDIMSSPNGADPRNTTPLGRSFFDVALTPSGTFDVMQQVSANITVFGGVHPVLGGAPGDVNDPGNLALWVKGTPP
jgi:hypothetical protein